MLLSSRFCGGERRVEVARPHLTGTLRRDAGVRAILRGGSRSLVRCSFGDLHVRKVGGDGLSIRSYIFSGYDFKAYYVRGSRFDSIVFGGYSLSGMGLANYKFRQMRFVNYGLVKAGVSSKVFGRVAFRRYQKRCVGLSVDGVQCVRVAQSGLRKTKVRSYRLAGISFSTYGLVRTRFCRASLGKVSLSGSRVSNVHVAGLTGDRLEKSSISSLRTLRLVQVLKVRVGS